MRTLSCASVGAVRPSETNASPDNQIAAPFHKPLLISFSLY